jgi:hypothetical protein
MIPKSGYRFSEKVMLKQQAKAKQRINLKSFRFSSSRNQKRQTRQKLNLKFTPARNRFSVNPTLTGMGVPVLAAEQAAVAQFTLPLPRLT